MNLPVFGTLAETFAHIVRHFGAYFLACLPSAITCGAMLEWSPLFDGPGAVYFSAFSIPFTFGIAWIPAYVACHQIALGRPISRNFFGIITRRLELKYFVFYGAYKIFGWGILWTLMALALGLTATPDRSDQPEFLAIALIVVCVLSAFAFWTFYAIGFPPLAARLRIDVNEIPRLVKGNFLRLYAVLLLVSMPAITYALSTSISLFPYRELGFVPFGLLSLAGLLLMLPVLVGSSLCYKKLIEIHGEPMVPLEAAKSAGVGA